MALDACFLRFTAASLQEQLAGSVIDKIYQPSKEEVVLHLRGREKHKLMISSSPNAARIHLTDQSVENPKVPPAFCMVLRKHLSGARVIKIYTPAFERVIFIEFEGKNDFFEPETKILLLEIMGRTSNIILLDAKHKIINAIKHVDFTMTRHREILPGLAYEMPPTQDKISFLQASDKDKDCLFAKVEARVSDAILDTYAGISPVVAREIAYRAIHTTDKRISELSTPQKNKLIDEILSLRQTVENGAFAGSLIRRRDNGKMTDFSFLPLEQYGSAAEVMDFDTPGALLEEYYTKSANLHRIKQKALDLSNFLTRTAARITRTMTVRQKELADSESADKYQIYGQIIQANLYQIKKGDRVLKAPNFFEEDMPEITIALQPDKSPIQNAQSYFKKYSKAKNGRRIIAQLIEQDKKELEYINSVFVSLCDAESEEDLEQIRAELVEGHYLNPRGPKSKKAVLSHPREFVTDDGYTVYVGKSNLQNDYLTVRLSRKNDIWLHTKGIHGSHTLLVAGGKTLEEIPDTALLQAAALAAYYSKGKESSKVEVDYCPVQNVKKPAGAKPGMVIYENYYTLLVAPDEALAERIRKK
ncbi:MAG: NFACT family protein [Clostridia bacterium]|nr:NFACT family protein [Clostridia bacterium]